MTLHWTKLKKAVEDAGGTWTTREEAEAFLAGTGVPMPVADPAPAAPKQAARLDRSRKHMQVFGDIPGVIGARYSQDGRYFNKNGEQVG